MNIELNKIEEKALYVAKNNQNNEYYNDLNIMKESSSFIENQYQKKIY